LGLLVFQERRVVLRARREEVPMRHRDLIEHLLNHHSLEYYYEDVDGAEDVSFEGDYFPSPS